MKFRAFHHPDVSLPVLRRRAADVLADVLGELAKCACSPGWCLLRDNLYPSLTAYHSAVYRLRREGLITGTSRPKHEPVLRLTAAAHSQPNRWFQRRPPWARKWNGIWYLLIYDVPEKQRAYRETLRRFLKRKRLGCLQKSAWVTPADIRPDYADLCTAGGLEDYSYLVEMRTVLGRDAQDVVRTAWDMDWLEKVQNLYCEVYRENLKRLRAGRCPPGALIELAREEQQAYLTAMELDPVLPHPLWPSRYHGRAVWDLHRDILKAIARQL